jgi:hypothetical protein
MPRVFFCIAFSTSFLIACLTLAQPTQSQPVPPVRNANLGEAATGVVVKETPQEIHINTKPCDANAIVVIFRKPYSRGDAGKIKCGNVDKPLVQVVQQ